MGRRCPVVVGGRARHRFDHPVARLQALLHLVQAFERQLEPDLRQLEAALRQVEVM